jgi:ferrochelatase
LQPYLEDEIRRLGGAGVTNMVVVPVSFVSDHIETLFELDQLYAGVAKEYGVTNYHRERCFNGDPGFSRLLYSLVADNDDDIGLFGKHYQLEFAEAVTA